ncbi:TlpA family protein disulfide reductase [Pedobacter borealis]|uniref:TlpA family protein disulfide reductase n=1 Tax=Pedobacter borealis TaxID=475254 RepID=UPI00068AC64E|nr:TlpA disulfide reductase family protein [Pedobacter borealis]
MKKKNLIILAFTALLFIWSGNLWAQGNNPLAGEGSPDDLPAQILKERLKDLVPLDPFKLTAEQAKSFAATKATNRNTFMIDGRTMAADMLIGFEPLIDNIVIPYINPVEPNKVVLGLMRTSTAEEKEARRNARKKEGLWVVDGPDPNGLDLSKPGTYEPIDFDVNLKKEDAIKGLHEMPVLKQGQSQLNAGRVAFFDEKGKLIPVLLPDGTQSPKYIKYMNGKDYTNVNYCDDNGLIKAAVFRKSTLEEKRNRGDAVTMTAPTADGVGGGSGTAKLTTNESTTTSTSSMLGQKAENFSAKDINGADVSLEKYKGKKVVVLNFWFTKCKPCIQEMPQLNQLVDAYQGKDVEFISLCNDSEEMINAFLKSNAFKYHIVANTFKLANTYKVAGFPTHVVIDKSGKIVFYEMGYSPNVDSKLKTAIDKGL